MVLAVVVGVCFLFYAISLQYTIRIGSNIDQGNYDGNFVMFCILIIGFLAVHFSDDSPYGWSEFFMGTGMMISLTGGVIFISQAYRLGTAAPNEAIKSNCSVIQTVISALISMKVPSLMQIGGLVVGIISVIVLVW